MVKTVNSRNTKLYIHKTIIKDNSMISVQFTSRKPRVKKHALLISFFWWMGIHIYKTIKISKYCTSQCIKHTMVLNGEVKRLTPWRWALLDKQTVAQILNILWNLKVHYHVHKSPGNDNVKFVGCRPTLKGLLHHYIYNCYSGIQIVLFRSICMFISP